MLKSRQKVVIDIAYINMTLKQLLYWMEMKPEIYVNALDSQLVRLGGWAKEVHAFLLKEENPMVFKLTRQIYPMTDLEYYLAIYKTQMPPNVASSIKTYVSTILKINKLYNTYRDKVKGDRLKYLVDGLANEKVADLLQIAVDNGLLDEQFQPCKETNLIAQKTIAYAVSQIMNFSPREKWVHFDKQWFHT